MEPALTLRTSTALLTIGTVGGPATAAPCSQPPIRGCTHPQTPQRTGAEQRAQLRIAQCYEAIPDRAFEGAVAACTVFPQRHRSDAGGGGPDLQHQAVFRFGGNANV